ncbi:MAG: hypothetical protein L3J51_04740 [Cocleimonas sp.]|nr:hypothetical protein [Cocleimonas sp.]
MGNTFRIALLSSCALLASCQKSNDKGDTSIENVKSVSQVLKPRSVEASTKHFLGASYLRDVLPESAYVYARIPNIFSVAGGSVGNVFDKALNSKSYVESLDSIKEGFEKEIIPDLPENAKAFYALLVAHITSPIEIMAMTPAVAKESPFPNVLLSVGVNFKDVESFNTLLADIAEQVPKMSVTKPLQTDGVGELKLDKITAHLKLDLATQRLFILGGMSLQETSLSETLTLLKPNSTHAMKALENDIDASGQGLFVWADPQKLLSIANSMGAQRQLAPLAMLGVNSMKNIAAGVGTSKGINRAKFILDMPATGFRGYIPTIKDAPSFKLAGKTDFMVTLGLPSKADFVGLESSIVATLSSKESEKYYKFKKLFAEKAGIELEEILDIYGQDMSIVSGDLGTYTAIRLRNLEKFNSVVAGLVKKYDLKYETRTISGQVYHHLVNSTFEKMAMESWDKNASTENTAEYKLLSRFLAVPYHSYWQIEGDYLLIATLPQVLMERHYTDQMLANEWLEKEQRMDPKGALLLASLRNRGVPAAMYRAKLALLAYLGDAVDRPVDLFSLPTASEANLPKEGAYGMKITSSENQLALELSFESNPAEMLFAGNSMAPIMVVGILSAIAVPAYEDYQKKARKTQSRLLDEKQKRDVGDAAVDAAVDEEETEEVIDEAKEVDAITN